MATATSAPSPNGIDSCDRVERRALAWCMRPHILDADRQLRSAYNEAVQAGVDRRVLAGYRSQWSKLRKRANSDPRDVALGYRKMAEQLDAARTHRLPDDL